MKKKKKEKKINKNQQNSTKWDQLKPINDEIQRVRESVLGITEFQKNLLYDPIESWNKAVSATSSISKLGIIEDLKELTIASAAFVSIADTIKPIQDISKIFQNITEATSVNTSIFKDLLVGVPEVGLEDILLNGTKVDFDVDLFSKDIMIDASVEKTVSYQNFDFRINSSIEMKIERIENKLEDAKEEREYLIELSENNHNTIISLVDELRKKTKLGEIKDIKYNHITTEIILNGQIIKLRGNTNQSLIARLLLNTSNLKKQWEIEDIIYEIGELGSDENWHRKTYDAIYQLNIKIEKKSGYSKFFILTSKTVVINPKYSG